MPLDKLERLRVLLNKYSKAVFINRKELESLTGLLAHCSQCVKGGCTFCRRLYDLYKYMVNSGMKRARITNVVREDIKWWKSFSSIFNGVSTINNELYPESIYTDASKEGFGAQLGKEMHQGFPIEHGHIVKPPTMDIFSGDNINELELWAVMSALVKWQSLFRDRSVNVFTDNMQVYHNMLSGRSANVTNMSWIR